MRVRLSYFRRGGKWYIDATYETSHRHLDEIWAEVRRLRAEGKLPGLVEGLPANGDQEFNVLVDVPDHPHRHPRLVML